MEDISAIPGPLSKASFSGTIYTGSAATTLLIEVDEVAKQGVSGKLNDYFSSMLKLNYQNDMGKIIAALYTFPVLECTIF